MRFSLLFLFIILSAISTAQRVVDVTQDYSVPASSFYYTAGGEPFSNEKYVRVVAGSPYFIANWSLGSVILQNGKRFDSLYLKLDLLSNELHFKNALGQDFVTTTPISEVLLKDSVSGIVFRFIHSSSIPASASPTDGWYQLLVDGSVLLFVKFNKTLSENQPYGSATLEQTITTSSNYFLLLNTVFIRIKKFTELPGLLKDKSAEMKKFILDNHISGKSVEDYIRVVSYYNTIAVK